MNAPRVGLGRFQIAGCKLPALGHDIEADALTFGQRAHSCLLDRADVHEYVFFAVFRLDETKTLGAIEKLYGADSHSCTLYQKPHAVRARERTTYPKW